MPASRRHCCGRYWLPSAGWEIGPPDLEASDTHQHRTDVERRNRAGIINGKKKGGGIRNETPTSSYEVMKLYVPVPSYLHILPGKYRQLLRVATFLVAASLSLQLQASLVVPHQASLVVPTWVMMLLLGIVVLWAFVLR